MWQKSVVQATWLEITRKQKDEPKEKNPDEGKKAGSLTTLSASIWQGARKGNYL